MDFLECPRIRAEMNGRLVPGKLKLTYQQIAFKNDKTGIVETILFSNFDKIHFQHFGEEVALRIFEKNGSLYRFIGFNDNEKEKIKEFLRVNHKIEIMEKKLSTNGWNWGQAKFKGSSLQFKVDNSYAFEIPLNNVSQCLSSKSEVTLEFHQNDVSPVGLMEMRFHIPPNDCGEDMVKAFKKQVLKQANIVSTSAGDVIATFSEIQCITPRGRYDLKIFENFIQLHGKTFDYKIPTNTICRLFLLPHRDKRQMYFILNLISPMRQGQTRYHYLVFIFNMEDTTTIELSLTNDVQKSYHGKLEKTLSGPLFNVVSKIVRTITDKKLIGPSNFIGYSGTHAILCSYKTAGGCLYPLEKGILFIYKPPLYLRFEEIISVDFARGESSNRSFDVEVEIETGIVHIFSNIDKGEYKLLYEFLCNKKIVIKKYAGKQKIVSRFSDSEEDERYDSKTKTQEKDGSSTDEDFNPDNDKENDLMDGESSAEESFLASDLEIEDPVHISSQKSNKSLLRTMKKAKKIQDKDKPKRPQTAFMLWLNENRNKIKSKNPDMRVTEIAKEGGRQWRELEDKSKWETKAKDAKRLYEEAMKAYKAKQDVD